MKKYMFVLTSLFLAGCGVLGIRSASEPRYEILTTNDKIEIRQYPPMVVAQTAVNADYKNSSRQGFNRLASYIFGNNKSEQKMTMTAPVFQKQEAAIMDMTVPVIQQKNPASLANGICATPKLHGIISPETFGFHCID